MKNLLKSLMVLALLATAACDKFKGPQGPAGNPGSPGADGSDGADGADADLDIQNVPVGDSTCLNGGFSINGHKICNGLDATIDYSMSVVSQNQTTCNGFGFWAAEIKVQNSLAINVSRIRVNYTLPPGVTLSNAFLTSGSGNITYNGSKVEVVITTTGGLSVNGEIIITVQSNSNASCTLLPSVTAEAF